MHKNNFYIWFGLWVAVLPFLGVPGVWKVYLTCASGIFLVLYAAGPMILKKLQTKPTKPKKKPSAKSSLSEQKLVQVENSFNTEHSDKKEEKPGEDELRFNKDDIVQ